MNPFYTENLSNDLRKKLSPEKYILKHHLEVYFTDVVDKMLACRSTKDIDPRNFLHNYFLSVKDGTNVLFREFSYINATHLNRKAFVKHVWEKFNHLTYLKNNKFTADDYHAFVSLLCRDFNKDILNEVQSVLGDSCPNAMCDFNFFIYIFQFIFLYHKFIKKCKKIFENLKDQSESSCFLNSNLLLGNLKHTVYTKATIYDEAFDFPELSIVRNVLAFVPEISFTNFLLYLSQDKKLNNNLGILPNPS